MKQRSLTMEETGSLCMALAHLIHAGIGTADALFLLAEDESDPVLHAMLQAMAQRADDGMGLAAVFHEAGCFPAYACTLVQVGERVGKTEQTLTALARYYEGRARMTRQLRSALLYPALLLLVLLAVVAILLIWVLPVFNEVYAQLGSSLTGFAGWLLNLGSVLRTALPYLCLVLALLLGAGAVPRLRSHAVQMWRSRRSDKGILRRINAARFIQALSLALSSGMTTQEAVTLASTLAKTEAPTFYNRCLSCLACIDAGASLAQSLRQAELLEAAQCRLLEAGTRSGSGEAVLHQIAERVLQDSEDALARMAGRLEPALVAIACVLIGSILLSVMLPLMHIMTAIG